MDTPYLRVVGLALFFITSTVNAEIYKWTDSQGMVNYSQTAPENQQTQIINTPPPPAIDPNQAKRATEQLIHEQHQSELHQQNAQQSQQQIQKQAEQQKKNCQLAKKRLENYQNNPGHRFIDAEGNVTRPSATEQQLKIQQTQEKIKQYCQ